MGASRVVFKGTFLRLTTFLKVGPSYPAFFYSNLLYMALLKSTRASSEDHFWRHPFLDQKTLISTYN